MEEKKILTDEELDNVVGGYKVGSYVEVPKCLGIAENGNVLKSDDKIQDIVYASKAKW